MTGDDALALENWRLAAEHSPQGSSGSSGSMSLGKHGMADNGSLNGETYGEKTWKPWKKHENRWKQLGVEHSWNIGEKVRWKNADNADLMRMT